MENLPIELFDEIVKYLSPKNSIYFKLLSTYFYKIINIMTIDTKQQIPLYLYPYVQYIKGPIQNYNNCLLLKQLSIIDISSYQKIFLYNLPMLEELEVDVRHGHITNIDISIFPKLKKIVCSQLVVGMEKINLEELSMHYPGGLGCNDFIRTCHIYPSIKKLSLAQYEYNDHLDPKISKHFPNLQELYLSGDMKHADLTDLKITHLTLDFDFMKHIPYFYDLIQLEYLNISGVSGSLNKFVNLTELNIEICNFEKYDLIN